MLESLPLTEASLLDLGRNPIINHHTKSLLLEAATIKIVCAINQWNTTPSTRQIQRTADRVPLCGSCLEQARAELTRGNGASADKEDEER